MGTIIRRQDTEIEDGMYQESEMAVRVGDVLAAKYRVDHVLGAGGIIRPGVSSTWSHTIMV